jgi:hypothetical protein
MVVTQLYRCPGITVEVQPVLKNIHSGQQTPDVTIVLTLCPAIILAVPEDEFVDGGNCI